MTAPIAVAPEEARKDYIATCFKMTHAELFQELMRVHQAAGQLMDEQVKRALEAQRANIVKSIENYVMDMDREYKEFGNEIAGLIEKEQV